MKLECLNDIISDRLAINIDASDINSWNLNTGFTSISLTKWSNAKSDNINLNDFGLTAYDNGRVNDILDDLTLTPNDVLMTLYRVGYNDATGGTFYDLYSMSGVTTGSTVGNYFELDGGYLQGFFKLQGQNYEMISPRFGEGITIENIIRIDSDSFGIFYLMGARSEDKYNSYFSGETQEVTTQTVEQVSTGVVGQYSTVVSNRTSFSGVTTSEDNYLNSYLDETVQKKGFSDFADATDVIETEQPKDSTYDNVISFELTQDKRITIKRITSTGLIDDKISPNIITSTGWTIITQVFTPDTIVTDTEELKCLPRRKGTLTFYVNGRQFWQLKDFDEYYFVGIKNDNEKVIGVPYNISWGGGSFGLKHSWHWDLETYNLYTGETQQYINDTFIVKENPLFDDTCDTIPPIVTGTTGNSIILVENSNTFIVEDVCNPLSGTPLTVMEVAYSGVTGESLNQYFIEFGEPIELTSNRDYDFSIDIYDTGIFQPTGDTTSSISLVVYGTTDVNVISDVVYKRPITVADLNTNAPYKIIPDQYQYMDEESGLLIYGETGYPVINSSNLAILQQNLESSVVTGENEWHTLKNKIETEANSDRNLFYVGILIESNAPITEDGKLYINNFKYKGSDVLNQDSTKNNQLIEQNFDSSYKGGIQKLRVYDISFDSQQVLHNARIESINNTGYGLTIRRGGRIIYN